MSGAEEVRYLALSSPGDGPTLVDEQGVPSPTEAQQRERRKWLTGEHHPSAVAIDADGRPVVALRSGELFTIPSPGKIRRWRPPGYAAAFDRLVRRGHETDVFTRSVDALIAGDAGLTVLTSAGVIEIPDRGRVSATPVDYPERPGYGITWAGGGRATDGTLVLATQATPPAPSVLVHVRPDGQVRRSPLALPATCGPAAAAPAGRRAGAALAGFAVRAAGIAVAADAGCRRVYEIQTTEP
ncbi:hypothetical protein HUT06_41085 [Actinomadura sp. NAK00032]|uniref:hypothetical protein n=1 Tax=Actinomadura sp. NAK00032 TaxID=2742128 RepID=UPI00159169BC|nr:hypothetical protein [Actinomadura sp. NAK00032]QKW39639.1 hypothetical protein HUT06_41085 [Actinomadura sp. NAK00032]